MRFLACLVPLFFVLTAQANTVCCEANGRTYCDEGLPAACYGKAHRILNGRGEILRQIEAPLTPEQKAKRDAELAKKKQEDERAAEEDRRNRKLLSTYATVNDLDETHSRVLDDMDKGLKQAQTKLTETQKKKKQLDSEAEFYKKRAMPESLKAQVRANETELKAQEKIVSERTQDIQASKLRFAEERTRYLTLTASNVPPGVR